jgi:hypothetical protein
VGSETDRLKFGDNEWKKKMPKQSMRPHMVKLYHERESLTKHRQTPAWFVGLSKRREDLPDTSRLVLEGQNSSSQR